MLLKMKKAVPVALYLPMGELARVVPVHGTVEGKKMTLDHQTGGMLGSRGVVCTVQAQYYILYRNSHQKGKKHHILQQLTETGDIKLSPLCSSTEQQPKRARSSGRNHKRLRISLLYLSISPHSSTAAHFAMWYLLHSTFFSSCSVHQSVVRFHNANIV